MFSVLLIEGDVSVAQMLGEVFAFKGWRADMHTDKRGAVEALVGTDHYDVIVTSYEVPGTTGVELAGLSTRLANRRATPVILITGSDHRDIEADATAAGVTEILHKPFSIHRLLELAQTLAVPPLSQSLGSSAKAAT